MRPVRLGFITDRDEVPLSLGARPLPGLGRFPLLRPPHQFTLPQKNEEL